MLHHIIAAMAVMLLGGCLLNTPGKLSVDGGPDGDGDGDVDADSDLPDGCQPEICNYHDDDCDGLIDDGFNLSTDPENCGACDTLCPPDPRHATSVCVGGRCAIRCDTGYRDCNDDANDGCEADLSSPETCGGCDVTCGGEDPLCQGDIVSGYSCLVTCTAPLIECDGRCVDTQTDTLNCDECGHECPEGPHGVAACKEGVCGFDCEDLFGDCDASVAGCETPLTSLDDCGGCGVTCELPEAEVTCVEGVCAVESCHYGWGDCDEVTENGCEQDLTVSEHCGECFNKCEDGEVCLYGVCVPPCEPGCLCADIVCSTASPCVCEPGCTCLDLGCAADCDVTCNGPDTICVVGADGVSNFNDFMCSSGALCIVEVEDAGNFEERVICRDGGTECRLSCDNVSNCSPICVEGAACVLECVSSSTCEFEVCDGALLDCGEGIVTCNMSCPP